MKNILHVLTSIFFFTISFSILAEDPSTYIDNERYYTHLKYQMKRMINKKKLVNAKKLFRQLSRRQCDTPLLTQPLDTKKTGSEIHKSSKQSVVILGKLYKKPNNSRYLLLTSTAFCLAESGIFITNYHVMSQSDGEYFAIINLDGKVYGLKIF